jgi:hypothetical protein
MSELSHTSESALRHSIERCQTLAFLAGTMESVPPEGVWSGLEGLSIELTQTPDAIRVALPADGLNAEVSALGRRPR